MGVRGDERHDYRDVALLDRSKFPEILRVCSPKLTKTL
jgi:hypothetical protein